MIHTPGSCERPGEWLQNVNPKILPEVNKIYAGFCLERGKQLLLGEHYDRAKQSIETALALQPESARAYDRLGWTLIASGKNPQQGISYALKSLQLNPFQQPSDALNTLAEAYVQTGQDALATETLLKLARAQVRWQQYQQAMDAYNQLLKLQTKEASQLEFDEYNKPLALLIKTLEEKNNFHKLAHYYEQALQAGFTDSKTRAKWANGLAWALIENDIDIAKGVAYAELSVELDPNYYAVVTLALGYIKQNQHDKAITILQKALQKQPNERQLQERLQQAEDAKKAVHKK